MHFGMDLAVPRGYAEASVTWWLAARHGRRTDRAGLLARVRAGPPATREMTI